MTKAEKLPAKAKQTLPATNDLSLFEGSGTGFENVTSQDLLIPRLTVLQGLSPQVTQGKPEFDVNAKVGMIYDVGLQEGFIDPVHIVPVHFDKRWLEWAPRATGKGLIKIHDTSDILAETERDEKNRDVLPNGNYVVETSQLFVLNLSADGRKSFIPFSSTQLKKARRLLTLALGEKIEKDDGSSFTPPLFYRTYKMTTVPESNNEGNWMGWKIERDVALNELPGWKELVEEIKSFRKSLIAGNVRADLSGVDGEGQSTPSEDSAM
jgi:hypothetical protein